MEKTPAEIAASLSPGEIDLLRKLCSETFATGWHPVHTLDTGGGYVRVPGSRDERPDAKSLAEKRLCELGVDGQSNQTVATAWCPDGSLGRAVAEELDPR